MTPSKNGDENGDLKPVPITGTGNNNLLSRAEIQQLAEVPPEIEWFANLGNPRTRRAYMSDLRDFMDFVGIRRPEEFRIVSRAHCFVVGSCVIRGWRCWWLQAGRGARGRLRRSRADFSLYSRRPCRLLQA